MAIDYTVDIVEADFVSKVLSDAAYQIPGTFDLPTGFGIIALSGGTIHAAGTGYSAGNVLTLSGGTSSQTAQITVDTVSTGAVATFHVSRPGAYTAIPTGHIAVTGGGGSGFQIDATWTGLAQQRILTFVELTRSYLNEIDNTHEAKLLQEVMARMMATMRFGAGENGAGWDHTTRAANAQTAAMRFIVGHVLPADL